MLLSCVLKATGVPVLPGWLVVHGWVHGWVMMIDGRRWILIQKFLFFRPSLTVHDNKQQINRRRSFVPAADVSTSGFRRGLCTVDGLTYYERIR